MNDRVLNLERESLTTVVQRVFGSKSLELCDWEIQPVAGGMESGSTLYRLAGVAFDQDVSEKWSLILKIIRPELSSSDPGRFRYWLRESLAYQSGFLHHLPPPIGAPQYYGSVEHEDGSIWIWLENIQVDSGHSWDMNMFGRAAFGLGMFNGAFLVQNALPSEPWFSRSWLARYLDNAASTVAFMIKHPDHPELKAVFRGIQLPLAVTFFRQRSRFLDALDSLPQTFCHQDAFHRNLLPIGDQWVGVDWGYAGLAPVGAEIVPLVAMALGLGVIPGSQAHELDRVCFSNYLQGLKQAGWDPDPKQVRLGFITTLFLRYPMGAVIGEVLAYLHDQNRLNQLIAAETASKKSTENETQINAYFTQVSLEALKMLGLRHVMQIAWQTLCCSLELKLKFK